MSDRPIVLLGFALAAAVTVGGCVAVNGIGDPTPTKDSTSEQGVETGTTPSGEPANRDSRSDGQDSSSGQANDPGVPVPDAGDGKSVTPSVSAFTNAPKYSPPSVIGSRIDDDGHDKLPGAKGRNPAGTACGRSGCHGPGTGEHEFLFAGTVYGGSDATAKPEAKAEIRVLDSAGNAINVYSDVDGNFFVRKGNLRLTGPVVVGVRSATSARLMSAVLSATEVADCNGCHTGATGQTARVVVR